MKAILTFMKTRRLAKISAVFILVLYAAMILADFISPYAATHTFPENSFHPGNMEISGKGLVVREFRVLEPTIWKYAKVKGLSHEVRFFVHGDKYRVLNLFDCDLHLFGTGTSGGENYPVYLFGADNLGRDLFSRIIMGSRISLTIGFVASAISLCLAIIFGGLAGFFGSVWDWTIMRFSEFFMLIPSLYLILFLRSLLNTNMDSGKSYMIITLILSLVGWPGSARTLRGIIHSIKREDFVQNAVLEGIPSVKIIFFHIIPQISSLLIVSTTLAIPGFIMSETTLSYLGLGISDPAVSWGSLINRDISTLSNLKNFPWLLYPVWLLLFTTLAFNFFGDALRDYFDPYNTIFRKIRLRKGANAPVAGGNIDAAKTDYLEVRDLHVKFQILRGSRTTFISAVNGISFSMKKGEILGIVGESGSGKSVSTLAVTKLLGPNAEVSGRIFFDGKEISDFSQEDMRLIRGRKIARIFQEPGRSFDPLQNIESVFRETILNSRPEMSESQVREKTISLLNEVGLPDSESRLRNFPHQFSGGQLQRISIALALAQDCELLVSDESTTALDVTIQSQIIQLLYRLKQTRNLSIIFISHNISLVAELCDRIIVMYGGKIMESGTSREIFGNSRHPYTKALIDSSPRFGTHCTEEKLRAIDGKSFNPAEYKGGCPFAPRCAFAEKKCSEGETECPHCK